MDRIRFALGGCNPARISQLSMHSMPDWAQEESVQAMVVKDMVLGPMFVIRDPPLTR